MKNIGETIAKYRKAQKLSQSELAQKLMDYGLTPSAASVSSWEKNVSVPNAIQIFAICEVLNIKDIYTEFISSEGSLLGGLNGEGIKKAMEYISLLKLSEEFKEQQTSAPEAVSIQKIKKRTSNKKDGQKEKREERLTKQIRLIRLYDLPASAGTGQFLDGENYSEVEAGLDTPGAANFGIRIAGNSMEPRYLDGQIAWVKKSEMLADGEIGIFLLNGEAYIKKLYVREDGVSLISLNPAYKPIHVTENDTFITIGKVLN